MGFLDKAVNKTKSVAQQADSRLGQDIDVGKVQSKINDEKKTIRENSVKIGEEYTAYRKDNDSAHMDTMNKLADECIEAQKKIEEYEKEIEDIKAKGHEEREGIRAEEAAKNAKDE